MKKSLILSACLMSVTALAHADNSYKFISLGVANKSYLADSKQIKYNPVWTPRIAAGVGYHFDINEDYSVDSELFIDYSKTDFTWQHNNESMFASNNDNNTTMLFDTATLNNNGKVETIGLWATARLNRHNLFSTSFAEVSPFTELSVGTIQLNPNNNELFKDDRVTAYKVVTGVTFNFVNDMSFSLGFGIANSQKVNAL